MGDLWDTDTSNIDVLRYSMIAHIVLYIDGKYSAFTIFNVQTLFTSVSLILTKTFLKVFWFREQIVKKNNYFIK